MSSFSLWLTWQQQLGLMSFESSPQSWHRRNFGISGRLGVNYCRLLPRCGNIAARICSPDHHTCIRSIHDSRFGCTYVCFTTSRPATVPVPVPVPVRYRWYRTVMQCVRDTPSTPLPSSDIFVSSLTISRFRRMDVRTYGMWKTVMIIVVVMNGQRNGFVDNILMLLHASLGFPLMGNIIHKNSKLPSLDTCWKTCYLQCAGRRIGVATNSVKFSWQQRSLELHHGDSCREVIIIIVLSHCICSGKSSRPVGAMKDGQPS